MEGSGTATVKQRSPSQAPRGSKIATKADVTQF